MIAPVHHRAAGLVVAADRRLPGFGPARRDHEADVHIHLDSTPGWRAAPSVVAYAAEARGANGEPIVTVSRSRHGFHFRYADRTRAWIAASGTDVWCTWSETASLDDTCTYLCGPILSLVLRLRGALAFHASAVQIGGGAVAFVGGHGAGKSTLAAALGAAGAAIVTDDVLHVRAGRRWLAEPFPSMVKLWPEGARMALGPDVELPAIAEGWDKRALHLGGAIPAAEAAVPLIAFACFTPRDVDASIAPLSPGTALVRLAANSAAGHLLDAAARAAEFRVLSSLVQSIPCFMVTPPQTASSYPAFVARVLDWACDLDRTVAS